MILFYTLSDNSADIRVSQVSADPETPAEIKDNNPKKAEPNGDTEINELIPQDPSGSAFKGLLICTFHQAQ
jgi:hypothetical protein